MGEEQASIGGLQGGQAGVGEAAAARNGHAVAAHRDVHSAGAAPQLEGAVGLSQVDGGEFQEFIRGHGQQLPPGLGGRPVGQGPVGSEDCVGRFGGPQPLVGGNDPAQARAAMDHVVPGQRDIRWFGGKAIQQEVGHQPGRLGRQVPGRVETVVAQMRDDPRRHMQGHGADGAAGVDQEGAGGVLAENAHALPGFIHPQGMTGLLPGGWHPGAQAPGQEGQTLGPGQHCAVGGIGRVAAAAGEIVQAGPGRHLLRAGTVFVPAHVVEPGVQAGRVVAPGHQPVAKGQGIELAPIRIHG